MAFNVGKAFRDVWHQLTSYDRHADFDSPYRTGQHVPLAQSRHEPLTSIATTASESRADVSSPYFEEPPRGMGINTGAYPASPSFPQSPGSHSPSPYSPGMRSSAVLQRSNTAENFENSTPGEIQMQAFQEGLPPPPPCSHSWKRIDKWAEEHYEELWDQLGEGATNNDLNALEHQLDCSLPMEVRESLQIHDGQEQGGRPTGIIFGSMLLDCEEIVHEWTNWKVVNQEYLQEPASFSSTTMPSKGHGSTSASSSKQSPQSGANPMWKQELLAKQDCQPPNSIQKVYAHPAWIPLARDWGGNCVAVDLAPGPTGKWGQVILFGRDYDCKYVVARSWSAFLATVSDDLNSGKWFVDEETNELKLREFKTEKVEPGYLDILRWRADQKYGRRGPRRRSTAQNGSMNGRASPTGSGSPYASPVAEMNGEARGRSMQRFSGASPVASPNRPNYAVTNKSSPLARVTEEGGNAIPKPIQTNGLSNLSGKLVEVATPRPSEDSRSQLSESMKIGSDEDKENVTAMNGKAANGMAAVKSQATVEDDNGMKTIEI